MPSPLTPRRGYVVTLSQVTGCRPRMNVACTACVLVEPVEVTVDANTDDELGGVVRAALDVWDAHMCNDTYSTPA